MFSSAKRKSREQKQKLIESLRRSLHKFLKSNTSTSRNPDELALVIIRKQSDVNQDNEVPKDNIENNQEDNNLSDHEPKFSSSHTEFPSVDEEPVSVEIYNPLNWSYT
jgi:hypothetical protein